MLTVLDPALRRALDAATAPLPKAVALPDHVRRVNIIPKGNTRVIVPAGGTWSDFFAGPRIDADFLNERDQPPPQTRKP